MNTKNVFKHMGKVTYEKRCEKIKQKGLVIWLTGLSGAGKSTIAFALENRLAELGKMTYCLDGDNLRLGLNSNLGFSSEDRNENIRRIAQVAKLFQDAAFITIVSCISPHEQMRNNAKKIIGEKNIYEVYIKAEIQLCKKRDPKGLYKKASQGQIKNFTGIKSLYEEPKQPDLIIDTEKMSIEESVETLLNKITPLITLE